MGVRLDFGIAMTAAAALLRVRGGGQAPDRSIATRGLRLRLPGMRSPLALALALAGFGTLSLAWASPAGAGRIISFQGNSALSLGGTTVHPGDLIDRDTGALVFDEYSAWPPDIDAGHLLSDGFSVLVSTATSMTLGGNFFQAGDVVEWDGTTSSARYPRTELGNPNVDALFLFDEDLTSETLLFSSSGNFTLGGTDFTADQLVLWNGTSASLFSDAPTLTGGVPNARNIDAVHVLANGNVVFSTAASGASIVGLGGTIQGEDLIEWDPIAGTASLYLDGTDLFDGPTTANLDAVTFIPEPGTGTLLGAALVGLAAHRRRRRARAR